MANIIETIILTVAPTGEYTSVFDDYPPVYEDSFRELPTGMANKLYRNVSTTPVKVDVEASDLGLLQASDETLSSGVFSVMSESNRIGPNAVTLAKVWTTHGTLVNMVTDGVHVPLMVSWRDEAGEQDISAYEPDTTPDSVVGDSLLSAFQARLNDLGYTNTQIAAFFGVTVPQFAAWVTSHTRQQFVQQLRSSFNNQ